jgi:hypothetical protein
MMVRRIALILVACAVFGVPERNASGRAQEPIKVPSGSIFRLQLLSPISTANNKKNDRFNCMVVSPDEFKEATVEGRITKLKSGGRVGKTSEIGLAFASITMPDGRSVKFDAQVMAVYDVANATGQGRADQEGEVKGKSVRKRTLKRSVTGAIVGGIIGGIFGGGQGAAIGAAVGAGLGATTSLSEKSPNMEFSEGSLLDVKTAGR